MTEMTPKHRDGALKSKGLAYACVFVLGSTLFVWAAGGFAWAIGEHAFRSPGSQDARDGTPQNGRTGRTKIAEGEYAVYEAADNGAVGPFGEEIYDFRESWTLWRTDKDRYQVEGERRFESPKDMLHENRFIVQLSRDFTVDHLVEFAKLKWRPDSGPLTCDFLPRELSCSSGGQDPAQAINLSIPMEHPFGLLWPLSPFSMSGLTRESEHDPKRETPVQVVSIEQPSAQNPIYPMVLSGQLRYLGEANIEAAGQRWDARKFSLKVALHPEFLIWTSPKGLLLALTVEHSQPNSPQEGMKLVHFEQQSNF